MLSEDNVKPKRDVFGIVVQGSLYVINNSHLISQKIFGLWSEDHHWGHVEQYLTKLWASFNLLPLAILLTTFHFKSCNDEKGVFCEIIGRYNYSKSNGLLCSAAVKFWHVRSDVKKRYNKLRYHRIHGQKETALAKCVCYGDDLTIFER